MKRKNLTAFCQELVKELELKPLEYWRALSFPHTYTLHIDDGNIEVEFILLEDNLDYLQIGVIIADDNWWRRIMPISKSLIVKKSQKSAT
jgi:hypothetical protein